MGGFRASERGGALWLELDQPPANVLGIGLIRELSHAVHELTHRSDLKVLVWASAVEGVFSGGVDARDHARDRAAEMLDAFHSLFHLLDALPQVTLAAVDGPCLGGGCELALFSDVVLASPRARFAQPEIDLGCFPPVASVLLPRLAGRRGYEMVLTGEPVEAPEAERLRLINRVVDDVAAEAERMVERLASKSGSVLALARRALRQPQSGNFGERLARLEDLYRDELLADPDSQEGIQAFLEKRTPRWGGG